MEAEGRDWSSLDQKKTLGAVKMTISKYLQGCQGQTLLAAHQISILSFFSTKSTLILFRKDRCLAKNVHLPDSLHLEKAT